MTELKKDQLKNCLATGATIAEVADLQQQDFTYAEIMDLLQTAKDAKTADKQTDAEVQAKAHQKLARPENLSQSKFKSVYNLPDGAEKPATRIKMTFGYFPQNVELMTPEEFDLLQTLPSGDYIVPRPDNSTMKVEVVVTANPATGAREKVDANFSSRGHLKHNLPSMVSILREIHRQHDARLAAPLAG